MFQVYLPTSQHALFGEKHQPQSTDPTNLNPRRVMLEIEQTELAIHWRGLLNYGPLHRQPLFGFNMIWISWSIFDSPQKYFADDGHFPFIFIYNIYSKKRQLNYPYKVGDDMIEIFCQPTENNLAGPGHETLWKCATGNLVISKKPILPSVCKPSWRCKLGKIKWGSRIMRVNWDHQWVDYICL